MSISHVDCSENTDTANAYLPRLARKCSHIGLNSDDASFKIAPCFSSIIPGVVSNHTAYHCSRLIVRVFHVGATRALLVLCVVLIVANVDFHTLEVLISGWECSEIFYNENSMDELCDAKVNGDDDFVVGDLSI